MICDFGCNNAAVIKFKSGKLCCSEHTSSCPGMRQKNNSTLSADISGINWSLLQEDYNTGLSQGDLIARYNITAATIQKAVKQSLLVMRSRSAAVVNSKKQGKGQLSEESRTKLAVEARIRILERYEAGWMPKAGRCKKYKYTSLSAGEVYLDGTWELAVAKWLDEKEYSWKRNTRRFQYTNLKGSISHYVPDFWVDNLHSYIEIKGYETELDRCKWSQFTEPLIVWKKKELTEMNILTN